MKTKRQTFKAIDLFDEQARVIFDKKSGDIIQYTMPKDMTLLEYAKLIGLNDWRSVGYETQKKVIAKYYKLKEAAQQIEPEPVPAEEPENPNQLNMFEL